MTSRFRDTLAALALYLMVLPAVGAAQETAAPPAPSPSVPAPPAAAPVPPAIETPAPSVAPVPPAPSTSRPALTPNAGDLSSADEVVLTAKPVAVLSGTSTWEDGFTNLKQAFRTIEDELNRAGIAPAGRPLTLFVETDDMGFRYDAMIPIAQTPEGRDKLSDAVRFGKTWDGKALRFVHKDTYDSVDSTYEGITAYLDGKNLAVKEAFLEEYLTDLTEPADPKLEINIYVQPMQ